MKRSSVRMGPISIFALVIILCLSVMAILTTATASANYNEASKQASFTTGLYANEVAAQEMLAGIDEILATSSTAGGKPVAMARLKEALPKETTFTDSEVFLSFVATDGRRLTVGLTINNDCSYTITQWKTSTQWNPSAQAETLWQGM